ncbi:MAG: tetratricopeptide repeat protein [Deltaproteobacteria bacterium]|nr:tetratricopeptide repeat protein [Deltaproteobacteria bacterium]
MTAELKDDAPVPPEINKYLAILSKDPGSMVFAPLAEAYRKAGMLDEAIAVARDGMKLRPDYVSGMVALGRAYFEKGLLAEARENLEKVLVIVPDNIIAANLLEEIKKTEVRSQKSEETTEEAVSQVGWAVPTDQGLEEEPEIIEVTELEELTELTEIEAEEEPGDFQVEEISFEAPEPGLGPVKEQWSGASSQGPEKLEPDTWNLEPEEEPEALSRSPEVEEKEARRRKEITTETIADLYIKQGYFDKAIDIYKTLYDADPGNDNIKRKLDELKMQAAGVRGQGSGKLEPETWKLEPEKEPVAVEDENIENIKKLGSWLKTIQSERRKG